MTIITLREGSHTLPGNVYIHTLEKGRLRRAWQALRISFAHRAEYDAVFVHMNPEYAVVVGPIWRMLGKKVGLWYVHKSANIALRIARVFTDAIFTVSEATFPLRDPRLVITGHGIDVAAFDGVRDAHAGFRIMTIGRISPSKQTRLIAEAGVAVAKKHAVTMMIYGASTTPEEAAYEHELHEWLRVNDTHGVVSLKGAIAHKDVPAVLRGTDLFVNMGQTGGVDKAVLEAMAAGVPTMSCSPAHAELLRPHGAMLTPTSDIGALSDAISTVVMMPMDARQHLGAQLRSEVVSHHSLAPLITRIIWILSQNK